MKNADPDRIHTLADLAREIDVLRRAEGRRAGKRWLSLQDMVRLVRQELGREVPRSTLDNYLHGRTLVPLEIYEAVLRALRVDVATFRPWADAWERLDDGKRLRPARTDQARAASGATSSTAANGAAPTGVIDGDRASRTDSPQLDRAMRELAVAVRHQWEVEAEIRHLHRPRPMVVTWAPTGRPVTTHAPVTDGSAGLHGDLTTIVGDFRAVSATQLVVLGEPGAGKTVAAILLTLGLLADPRPSEPVPVLLPLASWNPREQHLHTWLSRKLVQNYPGLASSTAYGRDAAARLVAEHRVMPVLDGLDEMPAERRVAAIDALDRLAARGGPLVVTCRAVEYEHAVRQGGAILTHAAVVELEPVQLEAVIAYHTDCEPVASARWQPVVDHLRRDPTGPLAQALCTPLMVDLARTAYRDPARDPAELCDVTRFTDRAQYEDHLLDEYLPAVYSPWPAPPDRCPPAKRPRYDPRQARQWLTFLADHLRRTQTQDIAWWRIDRTMSRAVAGLIFSIVPAALFAVAGWRAGGPAIGLVYGIAFGLGGWVAHRLGRRPGPRRVELRFTGTSTRFLVRSAIGATVGTGLGLSWSVPPGMVALLAIVFALSVGTHAWFDTPADAAGVTSPRSVLRNDLVAGLWFTASFSLAVSVFYYTAFVYTEEGRFIVLFQGSFDLVTALAAGTAAAMLGRYLLGTIGSVAYGSAGLVVGGLVFSRASEVSTAITASVSIGVAVGIAVYLTRASGAFAAGRLWLAARRHLPLRTMRFLDDAHRRGLLRQVGPVYQFRHARLAERLAAHHSRTRDPAPPGDL